jgi:SAM-dependent methyltransferase
MDGKYWDERYGQHEQMFSGNPNGVLVVEAPGLAPGQALDAGCGEGGDALWLARRGWRVTAVDISQVALERAAGAGKRTGKDVEGKVAWIRADLADAPLPPTSFDLVSVQYFPLLRQPEHATLRRLLAAVAPGGTLLFVGHNLDDFPPEHTRDFDPHSFYQPDEVAELLGDAQDDWTVLVNETRVRTAPAPAGTHHVSDVVLLARRR